MISEPNETRRATLSGLGFDTFDPSAAPPERLIAASPQGDGFDITFELTGIPAGLAAAVDAARIQGTILLGGLAHAPMPFASARAVLRELTFRGARVYRSAEFEAAVGLLAAGGIDAERLVTRTASLAEATTSAFDTLKASRDEMKILIEP
jgi:(R,R)-butanediol dehydrogenase/meso-butanediol dehydrogenase/diacetyl reductase